MIRQGVLILYDLCLRVQAFRGSPAGVRRREQRAVVHSATPLCCCRVSLEVNHALDLTRSSSDRATWELIALARAARTKRRRVLLLVGTLTTIALNDSSSRWLETCTGQPASKDLLHLLSSSAPSKLTVLVTHDPLRTFGATGTVLMREVIVTAFRMDKQLCTFPMVGRRLVFSKHATRSSWHDCRLSQHGVRLTCELCCAT